MRLLAPNVCFDAVEQHARQYSGLMILAVWAFCEAGFWFIAPDFVLIVFGFVYPKRWWLFGLVALSSSIAGGVVYYFLCLQFPDSIGNILYHTPFVTERMLSYIEHTYRANGYAGILEQSISFISFKIWTYQACQHGFSPLVYFILVAISRVARLLSVTLFAALVGKYCRLKTRRYFLPILIVYAVLFIEMLMFMED